MGTLMKMAAIALLVSLVVISVSVPVLAEPSITARWGGYKGPWPVTVVISDCKRLNLRSTPQLSVDWNVVAYPPRGTALTAIGREGDFIVLSYQGRTLYGYAAYLVPTAPLPAPTPPPVYYSPPTYYYPPNYYYPPSYYYPPVKPETPIYVFPPATTPSRPSKPGRPSWPSTPSKPGKPSTPSKPSLPPWWCP